MQASCRATTSPPTANPASGGDPRDAGRQASARDYAAIGDCRSLALVSRFGSIDWFCTPLFSGPSLFAALLDTQRGGHFALAPPRARWSEPPAQHYLGDSNVVRTTFPCTGGLVSITDFMPMAAHGREDAPQEIVRIVECIAGAVELVVQCAPRPGYASEAVAFESHGESTWIARSPSVALALHTTLPLVARDGALHGTAQLRAGEVHAFVLRVPASQHDAGDLRTAARERLAATLAWWHAWSRQCRYDGPYRDAVLRSALALKLLAYAPSGAVVAAGTTSLPEAPQGGGRNWDYRFCWLRDSSLVLCAFVDVGFAEESDAFLRWLLHATRSTGDRLQVVYDVHGEHHLPESVLPQLRGWRGIGPVRIGNAASGQVQHDIYGEVLVTAWEHAQRGGRLNEGELHLLAGICHRVCELWRDPDQGIWEIRLPPRHNTHSKLMCWAALDRGLQLQASHGLPLDTARVQRERDAIRADIEAHGFDARVDSYVGFYGSQGADASLLLMPRVGYLPADHPRMQGTVRHVFAQLGAGDLLHRYPPGGDYDGVPGPENLFAICNFWAVDCLARQGRAQEAQRLFETLLALRNPVGLYAEEFGIEDGRPVGNFPQAFSHVGLITAALGLANAQRAGH